MMQEKLMGVKMTHSSDGGPLPYRPLKKEKKKDRKKEKEKDG